MRIIPRDRIPPRSVWLGAGGLLAANLMLFGDLLWKGGEVLSSPQADLFLHFAAWREFGFAELSKGHLVLWNPHYLCGTPFLGNFESGLLYPPNWLHLFLPMAAALNLILVLHVFAAGLFTYLWALHRKLHPLAAFTSGMVYMLGGAFYLHLYAGHLPNLCVMAWAPLLFMALDGWFGTGQGDWLLLGTFALSMEVLAGHPQYVYFTLLICALYSLLNLWGRPGKVRLLAGCLILGSGAALLTAAQLWTGIQAFSECARNTPLEFKTAASFSFPPQNLLTLVLPGFFGDLAGSHYWSQWFLWEVSLFIGLGAFFLVSVEIFSKGAKDRRWALTTVLAALLLSLGSFTPLFRVLYDHLPWFDGMRGPCKFDFLAALFLALLAGMGMERLIRMGRPPHWAIRLPVLSGLLFLALENLILDSAAQGSQGTWGHWWSQLGWLRKPLADLDPSLREALIRDAGRQAALSLLIGGWTCLILSLVMGFSRGTRTRALLLALLVSAELLTFARQNRPTFDWASLQMRFDRIRSVFQADRGDYRVFGTGAYSLAARTYDLWEDEPMILGRYGRFICRSQGLGEAQLLSTLPLLTRFNSVFRMVRLKYLYFPSGEVPVRTLPFKPMPRMLLVPGWEVRKEAQILPALEDPSFDPFRKVFLESEPGLPAGKEAPGGSLSWKDLSTEQVEIEADNPSPAVLLITDNYSRGWKAEALPGSAQQKYQVLPADSFLRGIPLAQGKHRLLLRYRPAAFVAGKWVSVLSCLLFIGILLLRAKARILSWKR